MGLLNHMESLTLGKKDKDRRVSGGDVAEGRDADTSTLDKEEGNILMSLISQLRPGMDLTKIALPTFVLEPRSLLERITDFFSHPDLIFGVGQEADARERFLRILTFYLSGWHIKPRGVKKPYNPVLNEFFRCTYYYPDGSQGYYIAEQVSHHPPVSAFMYISPKNGILVTAEIKPKSKFLGNSAATIMEGEDRLRLLDRPEDGDYIITMPNTYARGILFGKMVLELGDDSTVENPQTGYYADVDFKTKGWISGGYNQIEGKVKGPKGSVGDISGMWSANIDFTDRSTGKKTTVFNAETADSVAKSVLPEAEQEPLESRRLWRKLTQAIKVSDMNAAQAAKSEVEDAQRALRAEREQRGEPAPQARFFAQRGDKWYPKLDVDNLPTDRGQLETLVRQFIFGGKVPGPSTAGSATPQRGLPAPAVEAPAVEDLASAPSPAAPAPAPTGSAPAPAPAPAPAAAATGHPVGPGCGVARADAAPVPGVACPAPGVPPPAAVSVAPVPHGPTPAAPTNPGPPA